MSVLKQRIKNYLSKHELNLAKLSSKIEMPYSVLFNIMDNKVEYPATKNLIKIADILNCTVDELLGRDLNKSSVPIKNYNHLLFKSVLNYCSYFINNKLTNYTPEHSINEEQILMTINEIYKYCNEENYKNVNQDFADMMLNNLFKL